MTLAPSTENGFPPLVPMTVPKSRLLVMLIPTTWVVSPDLENAYLPSSSRRSSARSKDMRSSSERFRCSGRDLTVYPCRVNVRYFPASFSKVNSNLPFSSVTVVPISS